MNQVQHHFMSFLNPTFFIISCFHFTYISLVYRYFICISCTTDITLKIYHFFSGFLAKNKGQVMRMSAIVHTLFQDTNRQITERAMKCAISFVQTSTKSVYTIFNLTENVDRSATIPIQVKVVLLIMTTSIM